MNREKYLILKNTKHTNDPFLDYMIDVIHKSGKRKTIKHWVAKFGHQPRRFKFFIKDTLLDKKIIRKEEKRFLFFKYFRYPLKDENSKTGIKKSLKEYLYGRGEGEVEFLFMLCGAIQIYNKVFENKLDRKKAKARFKELKKKDFVIKGVTDAVLAVQAAVIAASVATTSTVTR